MADQIQKTISISEALNERIKMTEEDLQQYKKELRLIKLQNATSNTKMYGKKVILIISIIIMLFIFLILFISLPQRKCAVY